MKLLFVDAFAGKKNRLSAELENICKTKLIQLDEFSSFEHVPLSNLTQFTFLPEEGYSDEKAATEFQKIDCVIIDGDADLLPWVPELKTLRVFLKACVLLEKYILANTFASHLLVYIFSTNGASLTFLDGDYRGGTIASLREKHVPFPARTNGTHFIDNFTGDIFEYDKDLHGGAWFPLMNSGIHLHRALGKSLRPRFRIDPLNVEWFNRSSELHVHIDSTALHHWLFKGLSKQHFVARASCSWGIRNPAISPARGSPTVLASCDNTPAILVKGNAVLLEFHAQGRYAETQVLVLNFLSHAHADLQETGHVPSLSPLRHDISLLSRSFKLGYSLTQFQNRQRRPALASNATVARGSVTAELPVVSNTYRSLSSSCPSLPSPQETALMVLPPPFPTRFARPFGHTMLASSSDASFNFRFGSDAIASSSDHSTSQLQAATLREVSDETPKNSSRPLKSRDSHATFLLPGLHTPSAPSKRIAQSSFSLSHPSVTSVLAQVRPATDYFPLDVGATVDWTEWRSHLPSSSAPRAGLKKDEIRSFLHRSAGDDENKNELTEEEGHDRVSALPRGLETQPPEPVKRFIRKPTKTFCSYKQHVTRASALTSPETLRLLAHETRVESDRRRDERILSEKQRKQSHATSRQSLDFFSAKTETSSPLKK